MIMEPSSVLGPTHPLTRAMRDGRAVLRQARSVAMVLVAALTAALNGLVWAWAGVAGAVAVMAGLGVAAATVRVRARWAAREVIADGGERLPLAPIERERARLLADGTRSTLASSLERMLAQAAATTGRLAPPSLRPVFDVGIVQSLADDLGALATALRDGPETARGVALVEQLVTWGGSSLYSGDVARLRRSSAACATCSRTSTGRGDSAWHAAAQQHRGREVQQHDDQDDAEEHAGEARPVRAQRARAERRDALGRQPAARRRSAARIGM